MKIRPLFFGFLGVIVVAILAYTNFAPMLNQPIDGGDDYETHSEVVERNTLKNIFDYRFETDRGGPSTYFTPVMWVLWKEIIVHGDTGIVYRMTGTLIHLFNILLVFLIMGLLGLKKYAAYLATLWFGFSAASLLTIGWVSGALTQGFALFFLLFSFYLFLMFLRHQKWLFYAFSLLVFLAGTFSKETVALHCWIFGAYQLFAPMGIAKDLRKKIMLALPYFILALPVLIIAKLRIADSELANGWGGISISEHIFYRISDYLSLLFRHGLSDSTIKFLIIAILLILVPLVWRSAIKEKLNLFLVSWLVFSLAVFSLSNFRDIISLDRYLYWAQVPFIGLVLFNASNIISGIQKWSKRAK